LLAGYGLGLVGAGLFVADPALGFPPGTPADANSISWHGLLHILTASLGFAALIGSCGVFSRRFAAERQSVWTRNRMAFPCRLARVVPESAKRQAPTAATRNGGS
jgi:hypothetical protein